MSGPMAVHRGSGWAVYVMALTQQTLWSVAPAPRALQPPVEHRPVAKWFRISGRNFHENGECQSPWLSTECPGWAVYVDGPDRNRPCGDVATATRALHASPRTRQNRAFPASNIPEVRPTFMRMWRRSGLLLATEGLEGLCMGVGPDPTDPVEWWQQPPRANVPQHPSETRPCQICFLSFPVQTFQ
jgi:hypothetical protein